MGSLCLLFLFCVVSFGAIQPKGGAQPFDQNAKFISVKDFITKMNAAATNVFNVRDYGAAGDGTTDDTIAFTKAVSAMSAVGAGVVYIPTGLYVISSTITFPETGAFELMGDGWDSNILWKGDFSLLVWNTTDPVAHATIRDFAITSVSTKSATSTGLKFTSGCVRSLIDHVLFYGQGTVPGTSIAATYIGVAIDLGVTSDTVTVRDILVWFCAYNGVIIGKGSEVRIEGGRIIGDDTRTRGIGVRVTGNNGGVHIIGTDIIALQTGVVLDSSNGAGSNREIFISQATLDSCSTGLAVYDNSYVDVDGVWAASSNVDQIWVSPQSSGATLVLTGGTIFNGGAIGGDCSTGCNGITVNAGSFSATGIAIRDNKGRGVYVPNGNVTHYSVVGCRVYDNGMGFKLQGSSYLISGNSIYNNGGNDFGPETSSLVTNNLIQ